MKKTLMVTILLVALAFSAFAQNVDTRIVLQSADNATAGGVYHLEVWDQHGATTDSGQFLAALNDLRKNGSAGFLIHGANGYIVVLYASSDWTPALQLPEGVTSKYTLAADTKQIVRAALYSSVFRQYITRETFLTDLNIVYNGLK
ncbi:MAG: hypothetical protein Ta2B_01400 [Termitinemataceae bacterium]|nr:MAG: hypothetical protein Ta2B_01400 [Termitinemataceae bacterium]